jgi:hypothetical protein
MMTNKMLKFARDFAKFINDKIKEGYTIYDQDNTIVKQIIEDDDMFRCDLGNEYGNFFDKSKVGHDMNGLTKEEFLLFFTDWTMAKDTTKLLKEYKMETKEAVQRLENTMKDLDRRILEEVEVMRARVMSGKLTGTDIVSAKHFVEWFGKDNVSEWVKVIANATPNTIQEVNQQVMETYFKEKEKRY